MTATNSTTTNHRSRRQAPMPDDHKLRDTLAECAALAGADPQLLLERAQNLAIENEYLRRQHDEFKAVQAQIETELTALTRPEQHPVHIVAVIDNGPAPTVEVAGSNGVRLIVSVHPDVPVDRLQTGVRGILSRERNCLLSISDAQCQWKQVGVFDEWLPQHLGMLVRFQEQLLRLSCAPGLLGAQLRKGDRIGFDEGSGIAFQQLEQPSRREMFFEEVVDSDFSHVGGLDRQIERIRHCLEFTLCQPEIASRYRLQSKRGLLFFGPPGNGKTLLARCIAGYLRTKFPDRACRFMHVLGSSDYSMWLGQSEQNLRDRFNAAREAARDGLVVMFFDELDALGRQRHSDHASTAPDRILNTFLGLTDGLESLHNVVLIGATNRADMLDTALVRPGRFSEKILIPAPSRGGALAILRGKLRGIPLAEWPSDRPVDEFVQPLLSRVYSPNGAYAKVAEVKLSDGRRQTVSAAELISGALLQDVVQQAGDAAGVRDLMTGAVGLSEHDLLEAFDSQLRAMVRTLTPVNVKSYCVSIPQDAMPVAVNSLLHGRGSHEFVRRAPALDTH